MSGEVQAAYVFQFQVRDAGGGGDPGGQVDAAGAREVGRVEVVLRELEVAELDGRTSVPHLVHRCALASGEGYGTGDRHQEVRDLRCVVGIFHTE